MLERYFDSVRESAKGIFLKEAFKQLICFFVGGTNLHLIYSDELAEEVSYAKAIDTPPGDMDSSYQVKWFLKEVLLSTHLSFP